jgi:peptidoglycan/LPS O-acetylase OafA/YrhL
MAGTNSSRNISIDMLRAVAILSVIALHTLYAWQSAPTPSSLAMIAAGFIRVAGHGAYGVSIFFVLSGYLITRATIGHAPRLFDLSIRDFYVRRIARIQPLLLLVIAVGLVALWMGPRRPDHIFQYVFRDPAGVFGIEFVVSLVTFSYNWERILHAHSFMFRGVQWDVMWSLAVEEQFYLAFPLIVVWTGCRRRLYAVLVGVVALGLVSRMLCDATHANMCLKLFNSFSSFDTLALGILCALLGDRLPHGRRLCLVAIAAGAAAIAFALYHGGVALLIGGTLLFIHGARYHDVFAATGRPLARIGQLSYGLYLLHPIAIYLASPLLARTNILVGFAITLTLAYALAEVAYRCYETPMSRLILGRLLNAPRGRGETAPPTPIAVPNG